VPATDATGRACLARLISVLPGQSAEGQPITSELAGQIGALAARTSLALQGLFHRAGDRALDWDVRRAPAVLAAPGVLDAVGDLGPRLAGVLPRLAAAAEATGALPAGLNHADVTLTNILVGPGGVTGLIDFGDMHHTAHVCDLAVALTAVLRNTPGQQPIGTWELAAAVLAGYQRHRPLTPPEVYAVLSRVRPPDSVIVNESTSTMAQQIEWLPTVRTGSFFATASGGIGWGVPAAVGVALADRDRGVSRAVRVHVRPASTEPTKNASTPVRVAAARTSAAPGRASMRARTPSGSVSSCGATWSESGRRSLP